ncbi:MAG: hypothetical protein EYC62_03055 [Alphaproteobacteria bacterium]|nr:MAG: hypothetical protein EYC62_03055 [Alphaproteobacteria bacterium]
MEYGARPLKRLIRDKIETPLASYMLGGRARRPLGIRIEKPAGQDQITLVEDNSIIKHLAKLRRKTR